MKITILFLAIISLAFVASNEMCRQTEIKVYSSLQAVPQSFNLDVKKIKGIEFNVDEANFKPLALVPIEQVGFILEKTASSKTLDAIHHKYLRNEPESVWMPYSYAGDWNRAGYVITNQMTRTSASKKETPLVSFEFVNDFDLMSVTSKDMDDFLSTLKSNSLKRQNIKISVKEAITKSHDAFTTSTIAHKDMKDSNKDARTQIASLKISLEKTTKEIITLTTTITTSEHTIAVQSGELSNINDKIDDLLSRLAALNVQLKKAEADLLANKPTDLTQKKNSMYLVLKTMIYPQTAPDQFLDEYSISQVAKAKIVQANYRECKADLTTVQQCFEANLNSSQTKRKLRRGFF